MDLSILDKVKSRKLAATVLIGVRLMQMDAPWQAFVILGGSYLAAEAVQMAAEKIADALKTGKGNPSTE